MQVRSTATRLRSTAELHCVFVREAVLARRRVMSSHAGAHVLGLAAVRSTARTAFDRTVCSLNFPETEQNAKNNLKKNKLKGQIKYEQNLQCRKIKTSRKIHQSKNYVNF
jgi:hypothetical protein